MNQNMADFSRRTFVRASVGAVESRSSESCGICGHGAGSRPTTEFHRRIFRSIYDFSRDLAKASKTFSRTDAQSGYLVRPQPGRERRGLADNHRENCCVWLVLAESRSQSRPLSGRHRECRPRRKDSNCLSQPRLVYVGKFIRLQPADGVNIQHKAHFHFAPTWRARHATYRSL